MPPTVKEHQAFPVDCVSPPLCAEQPVEPVKLKTQEYELWLKRSQLPAMNIENIQKSVATRKSSGHCMYIL